MPFSRFDIDGPVLFEGVVHRDQRGAFCETWRADLWREEGVDIDWVQDNQSLSVKSGTLRGLHWQVGQAAQDKLVRAVHGVVFDVAVDIRCHSPHFGRWVGVRLDSELNQQFLVPKGFAHGFCTLSDQAIVAYKTSHIYTPAAERVLHWADPALAIDWHISSDCIILADRDKAAPRLAAIDPSDLF
jgi:dTDP-4-dehydrorhamnose 3,5-epimerase